jgi:hypothetical protein
MSEVKRPTGKTPGWKSERNKNSQTVSPWIWFTHWKTLVVAYFCGVVSVGARGKMQQAGGWADTG